MTRVEEIYNRRQENKKNYNEVINNTDYVNCECGNYNYTLHKNKNNIYLICTLCHKVIKK